MCARKELFPAGLILLLFPAAALFSGGLSGVWIAGALLCCAALQPAVKAVSPAARRLFLLLLLRAGWAGAGLFTAPNRHAALLQFMTALTLPLFFRLAAGLISRSEPDFCPVFLLLLSGFFALGGLGALCAGAGGRLDWGFDYANAAADLLLCGAACGLLLTAHTSGTRRRVLGALTLLPAAALLLTGCRTAWLLALPLLFSVWMAADPGKSAAPFRAALLLGFGALLLAVSALLFPETVARRFTDGALLQEGLQARLSYWRDGWHILCAHPLRGLDAGGWTSRQCQFQTAAYQVRFVHSAPLQEALDGGFPGLLLSLAAAVYPPLLALKHRRGGVSALFSLALLLHGAVDFTLSYPVLQWVLLLCAADICARIPEEAAPRPVPQAAVSAAAVILALAALPALLSEGSFAAGERALTRGDYVRSETLLLRAVRLEPRNGDAVYAAGCAAWLRAAEEEDPSGFALAAERMEQARALDAGNWKYDAALSGLLEVSGSRQAAADACRRALEAAPLSWQLQTRLEYLTENKTP